jgi:hypothetical protein
MMSMAGGGGILKSEIGSSERFEAGRAALATADAKADERSFLS